jgi:hypothetical protein
VLVVALLLEEGKDEGVLQLPNFHEIHRNLRSMMKKLFKGPHIKESLTR